MVLQCRAFLQLVGTLTVPQLEAQMDCTKCMDIAVQTLVLASVGAASKAFMQILSRTEIAGGHLIQEALQRPPGQVPIQQGSLLVTNNSKECPDHKRLCCVSRHSVCK